MFFLFLVSGATFLWTMPWRRSCFWQTEERDFWLWQLFVLYELSSLAMWVFVLCKGLQLWKRPYTHKSIFHHFCVWCLESVCLSQFSCCLLLNSSLTEINYNPSLDIRIKIYFQGMCNECLKKWSNSFLSFYWYNMLQQFIIGCSLWSFCLDQFFNMFSVQWLGSDTNGQMLCM